jgi:hypothetical protein
MLGSKMTDLLGDLSWGFVRRCSCVVGGCGLAAFARSSSDLSIGAVKWEGGGTWGAEVGVSCCGHGGKGALQKVENRLHS